MSLIDTTAVVAVASLAWLGLQTDRFRMNLSYMTIRRRVRRRRGPNKPDAERKDYLIQARVPRDLDQVLKQDAKRRRLSVSHLIRNVLEDTYKLVDGVIDEVDQLVQHSVELSGRVTRDAKQIARSAAGLSGAGQPAAGQGTREPRRQFEASTADVYAWNPVVLNRAARCERCARGLGKAETAHLGLSQDASARPRWLCSACLASL